MTTHKNDEGFYANVHSFAMNRTTIEEVAQHIYCAIHKGYVLTEHTELGSILITPTREDVYIVPPEVMLFLLKHDAIQLNADCGGNPDGKVTLQ
jgi:hypothetical protein